MSIFRGFISIDIGALSNIVEFEKKIKQTGAIVKLVEPENIHITLKFLGDTDEEKIDEIEKIIKKSVEGIKPFNIQLKSTGVFPNEKYIKIVWLGIQNSEKIAKIASKIDKGLSEIGFSREKREFSPHLTIARVKSAKNKDKILKIIENDKEFEFADIIVESIKLKKSDLTQKGPIYNTLIEIKL